MQQTGHSAPLGATVVAGGVNVSLFSRSATGVELLLFDRDDDARPARVLRLDPVANRTYHSWMIGDFAMVAYPAQYGSSGILTFIARERRSGTMKHVRLGVVVAWALTLLWLSAPGQAQQTSAAHPEMEEQAMAVLKRMAEFLAQAQRFSVTVDTGFDVVQDSGQKIEFGETRQMVLRRPDRLRIDATKRNGSKSGMLFDGKDIAVFNTKENVYATVARPGTVDEAIAYFLTDLDMRLPLAELLSSHLAKTLPEQVRAAAYVETAQIAGVPCDHLALRGDQADMQLWVAQGNQPLPRRLVITYTREEGRPQFWAQFSEWNLAPEVPDALFVFTPPAGAAKIAFARQQRMQPGAAEEKGR